MKLLVIGQNPALSMKDPLSAFIGTKSGVKLLCWLDEAGIQKFILSNVYEEKTIDNKPPKRSVMAKIARSKEFLEKIQKYDKILAVGRQAEFALELAKIHHDLPSLQFVYVPHPSGLNRTLNNPGKEKEVVEMIRVFVKGGIHI